MPQIILGPQPQQRLDDSVKKAAFSFLERLWSDDAAPALDITRPPVVADPRVHTGRVSDAWRAVVVKIEGHGDVHYVYLGTFPRDEAYAYARTASVRINPHNGIAELVGVRLASQPVSRTASELAHTAPRPTDHTPARPLLDQLGYSLATLLDLGFNPRFAEEACAVAGPRRVAEDALDDLARSAPAAWQGHALTHIVSGTPLSEVRELLSLPDYALVGDATAVPSDDHLLEALTRPAARRDFGLVTHSAELRAAIEDENFAAWRVFLLPEQLTYATRSRSGSFRLSGGAGTGKTVVLVHRARHLARQNPNARIILTTFNRTLARSLADQLRLLDPDIPIVDELGKPGVFVAGLDQIASQVLRRPAARLHDTDAEPGSVAAVLGSRTPQVLGGIPDARWNDAVSHAPRLPSHLRKPTFLQAEYSTVVLPNKIITRDQYLRVRRSGRGTALGREQRSAVWDAVTAYRESSAADATTDFEERAMIAATDLNMAAELRGQAERPADHVIVDEGQDLSPSRLHLLRALVAEGPNDLFLAEDSQQRIYGEKIVLARYGIRISGGRSKRLTLNYRTTAQNLRYAVGVLADETFLDMEETEATVAGYRSVRDGKPPLTQGLPSLIKQYERTAELIRSWIDDPNDPTRPETIGVLVRQVHTGRKLADALADRGVDAPFIKDGTPFRAGTPVVMTMHRAKGMEFRKVILFDVSESSDPRYIHTLPEGDRPDARRRERSLVYVAATRARDELVVLWRGSPSPLLPHDADPNSDDARP